MPENGPNRLLLHFFGLAFAIGAGAVAEGMGRISCEERLLTA